MAKERIIVKKFQLKPGINKCTNEEYHGDNSYFSSTSVKLLLEDPAKFYTQAIEGKREFKHIPAFDEGSYAHALILEPEVIESEFAFYPKLRKAGNAFKEFEAANKGKIILSNGQKMRVESWVEAYERLPAAKELVSGGLPEHTVVGSINNMPLKARADYLNIDRGYIADVKTTSYDTDVDSFRMTIGQFKYQLSAALYCAMFEQYYEKPFDFYFIVLGKRSLDCQVYKMSNKTMMDGKSKLYKAIKTYNKCKESGLWVKESSSSSVAGLDSEISDYEILEI